MLFPWSIIERFFVKGSQALRWACQHAKWHSAPLINHCQSNFACIWEHLQYITWVNQVCPHSCFQSQRLQYFQLLQQKITMRKQQPTLIISHTCTDDSDGKCSIFTTDFINWIQCGKVYNSLRHTAKETWPVTWPRGLGPRALNSEDQQPEGNNRLPCTNCPSAWLMERS